MCAVYIVGFVMGWMMVMYFIGARLDGREKKEEKKESCNDRQTEEESMGSTE